MLSNSGSCIASSSPSESLAEALSEVLLSLMVAIRVLPSERRNSIREPPAAPVGHKTRMENFPRSSSIVTQKVSPVLT
jgi:hypothetical protein